LIKCYLFLWSARQQLLTLLGVLPSLLKTSVELRLENLALRHQLGVLRRSAPKRLKLMPADRILRVCYAVSGLLEIRPADREASDSHRLASQGRDARLWRAVVRN
jgi:hypothetical protein